MARRGFTGVSLQEIANKAGLHKSSLFHYFNNKEKLLLAILEKPVDDVNRSLERIIIDKQLTPEEALKMAIHNHLSLTAQNIDNVNISLNEIRNLPKNKQWLHLKKMKTYEENFTKIVGEMKKKGYFDGLDAKIVTFGVLGMLNWTVRWYKKDGRFDISKIANDFCGILLHNK
jgi:AcrR family transcriptional regulator